MSDNVKPSDVLYHAVELLDYYGWCKLEFLTPSGKCCMVGAIRAASGADEHKTLSTNDGYWYRTPSGDYTNLNLTSETLDFLQPFIPKGKTFTEWNDMKGRTYEQVRAKLIEAALFAESKGR